ncbi:MAG: hypothetical protein JZU63_09990, partial [Rhodoferax sp.]|nr:hypothetical protein [Rhodoferax sp.]
HENPTTSGTLIHFEGKTVPSAFVFGHLKQLVGTIHNPAQRFFMVGDHDPGRDGNAFPTAEMQPKLTDSLWMPFSADGG